VTGAWTGAGYGWRSSWLVAGREGFWDALATWVEVGSSSPQVPGHPTSMCDAGVKYFQLKGHFMTYMLFAGWEVRRVKNCDRSLENAAFSSRRSQFFTRRTDPKPVNNLFIFSLSPKRREKKLTQALL